MRILVAFFYVAVGAIAVRGETVVLVEGGVAGKVQFIGDAWVAGDGYLEGRGEVSRLVSGVVFAGGDFRLRAKLAIPRLVQRQPEVGIGEFSHFQLDANGRRLIVGGPLFVSDEQMIRYSIVGRNTKLIEAGKPFVFEAVRRGGEISFSIDGEVVHSQKTLRERIGPVSLFAGRAVGCVMRVYEFSVEGKVVGRYEPGRVNAYGAVLHDKVQWRPGLRLGHFVRLADGGLATMRGDALSVSHDDGKSWEVRKVEIRSEAYGKDVSFGGVMLVKTGKGTLVGATINDLNYEHLKWDDAANRGTAGRREVWTLRSLDGGKTWVDLQKVFGGYCGALVDMLVTSSGNVVIPIQEFDFETHRHITRAYVSADEGKHWAKGNTLDVGGRGNHAGNFEPTLAELPGGRLMMLMRTNLDYLWAAYAESDGLYWRETRPSGFDASSSPAYMTKLASGRIVLVWNRLYPEGKDSYRRRVGKWSERSVSWHREELSISFSDKAGKDWSEPVVIARKPGLWMAYPYVYEYRPGKLWVFASNGVSLELDEGDFVGSRE